MAVPSAKGYIFTERLGSGTYATVCKAYRKGAAREVVAIKCVQKSKLNRVSTENLLTEIELLKTLRHEHIVELKDFQWDANYIYLIMEYCSGGDLSRFIQSHRILSEFTAKRFLQQLALALKYMREMNVSHLDLKPQNILLSSTHNPVLKIGDFGFAHYVIGETEADILRGSPLYMAPEIITKRQYDEKADLWSVGVILYECLFGQAPFASKSHVELEKKIKDTKPIQLPSSVQVSDSCRKLLHGLLQRDPEKRMSFEEFFACPFIDLEHRPQAASLSTAIELVTAAVKYDNEQKYHLAVEYYSRALEHFIPSIQYEKDDAKKQALRMKVKQYMHRAEELKVLMKSAAAGSQSMAAEPNRELVHLASDYPGYSPALLHITSAHNREESEDFAGALKEYELALDIFIHILQEEPKGRRKDILQSQVSRWMANAERIKNYLRVKDLDTSVTLRQEEEEDKWSPCTHQ